MVMIWDALPAPSRSGEYEARQTNGRTPCADQAHALITEEDYLMFHQCIVNFLEGLIAKRLRNVDTADLSADKRTDGING